LHEGSERTVSRETTEELISAIFVSRETMRGEAAQSTAGCR
jgi:hypothetical protein